MDAPDHSVQLLQHQNRILRAIRNVNQLLCREQDTARLLDEAVSALTESRGYYNAWVALIDEAGNLTDFHASGLGEDAELLLKELHTPRKLPCCREALQRPGVSVCSDPKNQCRECPLSEKYAGRGAMATALRQNSKTYGLLAASVPHEFITSEENLDLFTELADDLAHALHDSEIRRESQQLRESLELANHIVETGPAVLFRWKPQPGWPVAYVSDNVRQFGYQPDDLRAGDPPFTEIVHPDDLDEVAREVREHTAARRDRFRQEYRIVDAGGNVRWVADHTAVLRDEQGDVLAYQGLLLDITERMEASETLRRQAMVLDQIQDLVTVTDADGVITYVNGAVCRMLGRTREELIGLRVSEFGENPQAGATQQEILRETLRTGSWRGEVVNVDRDGREIPLDCRVRAVRDSSGQTVALCGISTDITRQKQNEDALRALAERLELAKSSAEIGTWDLDLVSNELYWDERMYEIYGVAPDDFVGEYDAWQRALHPDDHAEAIEAYHAAVRGDKEFHPEFRIIRPGGEVRYVEAHAVVLREDSGKPVRMIGANMDVTGRRIAEQLRQASEERFRILVENVNDIIYSVTPDGMFTYVSPNWQELMGEPAEVAVGRHFAEYVLPEDAGICADFLQKVLDTGKKQSSIDYRVTRADGLVRWHTSTGSPLTDDDGKVIGYVGVARDVTEQKRRQQALQRSEQFLTQTGRMARVGGWEIDLRTNTVHWTPVTCEIHELPPGYQPDVDTALEFFPPESREPLQEAIHRAVEFGEAYDLELDFVTSKGNKLRVRTIGRPVMEDGKCIRLYGTFQDITERHSLEQQLRQAQKMEAIGQLAGGVAHDFNNLLTPILGYADMVALNENIDGETRQAILEIHRAATQARDLTRQLLAFGRKQIMEVLPLDLNELLRENQSILRRVVREDIELQLDLADDLKTIEGDPSRLSQVILNLAVNAVDAMPEGGTLALETYNVQIDENYVDAHPGSSTGPHVVLAVSDTGCGMDEQQQNRIFEPFFTTKEETKGTGLGLATVYGLVKQHRGSIRVYSEPGMGSTFRIYLPAVEAAPEASERTAPGTTRGNETILVVEDDPAVLKYTHKALEKQGYTVLSACNPEEALAHARDSAQRVDLLLTDVVMPEMNGAQLHEKLSAVLPELAVLYMSGYTGNVIARHGVLKEGIDFIQKPFDAMELAGRIRQLLDRAPR